MAGGAKNNPTFSLFSPATARHEDWPVLDWPAPERFPLDTGDANVRDVVVGDLRGAISPLIVTGFASLDRVIDFIADCPETSTVRLLLGTEPFESRRQSFRIGHHSFCSPRQVPINDAGVSLGQVVIAAARGLGQ